MHRSILRRLLWPTTVVLVTSACTTPAVPPPSNSPSPSPPPAAATVTIAASTDCLDLAVRTVDALQAYVDDFAGVQPEQVGTAAAKQQARLDDVAAAMQERAEVLDCDRLREQLTGELWRLQGTTPLADSVAATIRGSLLGSDDPSDPGPTNVTVDDVDGLLAAIAQAGTGSVITLAAGTYDLEQTLVLFRPVTLRGAASRRTVITSSAEGAALLSVAHGTVELRDLTIRHTGRAPASVVVIRTGSHALDNVEITGARGGDDGAGGFGLAVQLAGSTGHDGSEVRDSTFRDNEAGALLFGGDVTPAVSGVVIEGPGACGICFHGEAAGLVEGVDIEGQDIGIRIEGGAMPAILDSELHDNTVGLSAVGSGAFTLADNVIRGNSIGVEIGGSGSPTMDGDQVVDNTRTGLLLGERTEAVVTNVIIDGDSEVALVITDEARPSVDGGSIASSGEAGIVVTGRARGVIAGARVTGSRIGVQVEQEAGPVLERLTFEMLGEAAVVMTGQSTPSLTDVTCMTDSTGIVVLLEDAAPDLGPGIGCEVIDER